jgi:alpha-L-rhamnosidase
MLNQLWNNILWTQRNNMISVPTDCPQRDERMGWMGDAQVFAQTAIYNLDMAAFLSKWVKDIRDAQDEEGRYPDFAPHPHNIPEMPFMNAPAWADAGIIIPWRLYQNYGDKRIIKEHYHSAIKFVSSICKSNENLLWVNDTGNMYGDWLNGNTIISDDYPKTGGKVPDDVFATAFFYNSVRTLSKMAGVIENYSDQKKYLDLAAGIKRKFSEEFVDAAGRIKGDTQAGYAMALSFGLLSPEQEAVAIKYLVECIHAYGERISTGFISTILMMQELSKRGYNDLAYKLAQSKRFPSWGYSIEQGATTIWERWDGYVKGRGFQHPGMNSFNHYAIGAVGEWFYNTVLGINLDEESPGFKHVILAPKPGGTLIFAEGSYHSINGVIKSKWEKKGTEIHYYFSIPKNTHATLKLVNNKNSIAITDTSHELDFQELKEYGVKYWLAHTGSGQYHVIEK